MKKFSYLILSATLLLGCQQQKPVEREVEKPSDKIYQYSLFTALANSIYDGTLTVAEVKENGNLGLGTFNGLNGEMIVCDGTVYQFLSSGTVRLPENSELVPFFVVTFFDENLLLELPNASNYLEVKSFIEKKLPSKNNGYAFKIHGNFSWIKCGSAKPQEKPYTNTLSEALIDRPMFENENIPGTIVGFWYPEYAGKINVAGFHFHFISDDKKVAGHVIEFSATDLKIGVDICSGFDIELPETTEFEQADFDLSQEYNNKK